jgi:glutathione S-transferase
MNHENIILWGVKASPYVRKVMVALSEKQISYEQIEILPKTILELKGQIVPNEFDRASPLGKIPALQVNDFYIADSAVISAYLDRQYTTGTLLYPSNPEEYAKALWFERYADTTLSDITYKKIFIESVIKPALLNQKGNKEIIEYAIQNELPPMLDYINWAITENLWIAGDHFSMADVAIVVQLLALKQSRFEISENRWLGINNYLKKVLDRPSFQGIN